MSQPAAFGPARPEFRLNNKPSASLSEGLIELRVHEDQSGLVSCEARFGNWGPRDGRLGFLYFGRDELEFGKDFAITLGGTSVFAGRISGLEASFPDGAPSEMTVLAEDGFQDLRMTRRTRSFPSASDAVVMRQIAADHGLTADVDVTGPTHAVLAQLNQSDLAFLRERARAVDAELWLDGRTLHVAMHTRRVSSRVRLGYGNELVQFKVLADLAQQQSSVTVTGWDVAGKRALAEKADDGALGAEINQGDSGAAVLRTALATRQETVAHTVPIAGPEAKARAEAIFRRGARRFLRGHGTARAGGRVRVGATVQLDGLGPLFSGDYYVSDVLHRFDGIRGFRTEFTVERAALGRPA